MAIKNGKNDEKQPQRWATPPYGKFGGTSEGRPEVTKQPLDPTQQRRAVSAPAPASSEHTNGLERSDEDLQRASESGVSAAAEEKRESDDVDSNGRAKR